MKDRKRRETYFEGWTLYPMCALGHHLQGALVVTALLYAEASWVLCALMWTVLYLAYQGLSVLRKQDSPGLDIADFMAGAGLAIGTIIALEVLL